MSDGQRRARRLPILALLLLSLVVLGPVVASSYGSGRTASGGAGPNAGAQSGGHVYTVSPNPNSTMALWPYTSRSKSVDGATLPINIVVFADVELVRSTLIHRPDAQWEDQRHGLNATEPNASVEERTPASNATEGAPSSRVDGGTPTPNAMESPPTASVDLNMLPPNGTASPRSNGTAAPPNATVDGSTANATGGTPAPNATEGSLTPTEVPTPTETPPPTETTTGTPTPNETTEREGDLREKLFPTSANSTGVYWSDASGSDRYTYVTNGTPEGGRWIDEAGQLHDGDYFGVRYHIRFYDVSDGEHSWTALQVHREHLDWFRLRHTVGSLPGAQHYVETQFYDKWYTAELHRQRFTGGGVLNADGWVTVVEIKYDEVLRESMGVMWIVVGLLLGSVIGGWTPPIDRRDVREVVEAVPFDVEIALVAAVTASVPLFVRAGSLAVERAELVHNADLIAAAFYPLLALGLPVCAYVLARGLEPQEAFTGAAGGLGVGILLDYTFLGITVLPIQVIVHRAFLLVALGVVAVAGTGRTAESGVDARDPVLLVGAGLWVGGLLWALFLW